MPQTTSLVPIWPEFIIPTLTLLADGKARHRKTIFEGVADAIQLSETAQAERLKSGGTRYEQRMGWVLSHLDRANWTERPSRGVYVITKLGKEALATYQYGFDYSLARKVFSEFWPKHEQQTQDVALPSVDELSDPFEIIEDAMARIELSVGQELLDRLREGHPDFFEQAVVDLLLNMGYGGASQRGKRIGGNNDEGVDGIINQDALGLDQVYVQAKRYKEGNNVGREAIQAFVGALHGFGATRGVFLTTSAFTSGAIDYAKKVSSRIILIDGEKLIELMISYRVGVEDKQHFKVVKIDEDYFD